MIAIGIRQLQHRNFSVAEPLKSAARFSKSRGHFCDVLASECPCRAAGDFQPAPIRRLEALCTARRGTRMSLDRFQGASRGQPLKRRVDAAYLQPYGFRFQLSRFLPAENQRLLRRLVAWQLHEGIPQRHLTRGARKPHGAKRFAPTVLLSRIKFPSCEFF